MSRAHLSEGRATGMNGASGIVDYIALVCHYESQGNCLVPNISIVLVSNAVKVS